MRIETERRVNRLNLGQALPSKYTWFISPIQNEQIRWKTYFKQKAST